ncbi:phosphoglucosamine mutase [Halohasta litchfieldiae]|jgi:phosphoglucosamine mutase|uniref:Phosphoglucosamine mutase n=1 Tax=Halohasta litchfieldiae TaxID=1073996 RepID=A0A1H6X633_9EURY|nr:phosphoglucosamine mutase [Halohasta litchfieldiae]ATW90054.1 phosphoglucosamine mutase [Halohasta litchfieldiae]SEJ24528.1 phosphoglucosamine mutase [Halohasta litchfieldiae]
MFGTSGVRGPVGDTVTADLALSIGRAVATDGAQRVVIGRDARDSGRFLADAVAAGLSECGADVIDLGRVATPTLARSISRLDADAGVVITASHNPAPDNGIKLWTPSGQAFDTDRRQRITEIVDREASEFAAWDESGGRQRDETATAAHKNALLEAVDHESVENLEIVVDVGNGVGGVTAAALSEAGADVTTLNAQPDGSFPGRPSEPTAETLTALCAQVGNTDADLGVAHDGDADRMMAVDETGTFVPKDVLLALFAQRAVQAAGGGRVAVPVDTSLCVDDAITAAGGEIQRTKVGDVFVAEAAADPEAVFGGEPSGAWIWPDETLCPDGPLAACKLAALVGTQGSLAEQVGHIENYPLFRESIAVDDKQGVMDRVAEAVQAEFEHVDTTDGVRIETDDGWVLIRASGTQPLVRVTAEARTESAAERLRTEAVDRVTAATRSS